LYGSTYKGGTNGNGALFRLATNGTFVKLHDFNGDDGATPSAALVVGPDGALYGSTQAGGTNNNGAFFRLETNGSFTKLRDLSAYTDGSNPVAALVEGPDGMLYGSAQSGGASGYGAGTLFRLESNGSFTKLYDFNGGSEGYQPSAALAVGPDGALYGSTYNGGAKNYGMLFRVEADSTFTKLYDFDKSDGVNPSAALVVGPDGALYGSAYNYGRWGGGTLFRVETNGNFSKLHDFNHLDGLNPDTALVVGPGSALYGTTYEGGLYRLGTLFRVGTNGSFTNVHVFDGTNGSSPSAALVTGPDGALYGSAQYGGTRGYGALFRLQANGSFTNVHAFDGTNGAYPSAALVVGPDGALYGSTEEGGTSNRGTLFRFEANGSFSKLHDFNGTDGAYGYQPPAALVVGPDGALYGSTANGGTHGYGTLFRLQTDGSFTKLHDFNGTDGAYGYQRSAAPALVVGPDGALYGSTDRGGTNGYGTLFRVDTNAIFTKLYDFNGANGAGPSTPLVVGPDGALYGSTPGGGPRQGGILFKVVLNRAPVARCHDVTVSARANCGADASVDNGSFDPDTGDTITVRQEPPGPYPLGKTAVTLSVTDNHAASNSCAATVTVVDTTPPTISDVTASPNVLWPANHKMVDVVVNYTAMDDCGTVSNALFVASNEAPNGGAGDWVIEDEHHVQLRAERASAGTGRVYSITVISTDKAGNSATKTATVTVPKSHGK
jgi:uncharacterized repeat protein (TIGR03803 family)